jgi:Holliday junction DNA helicase RuvB
MDNYGPKNLREFIGQDRLVEGLLDVIHGPQKRDEIVPNIALFGPGGYGKTTLAELIAKEAGKKILLTTGKSIDSYKTFIDLFLSTLKGVQSVSDLKQHRGNFILIDEVHTLREPVRDAMLPFLQTASLGIVEIPRIGRVNFKTPIVSVIIATTDVGRLGGNDTPFIQRFVDFYMEPYTEDVMRNIGLERCKAANVHIDDSALSQLVMRCRNTPRFMKKLIDRCINYADARNIVPKNLTISIVEHAMQLAGVDGFGLREVDRRYLTALRSGPKSAKSISACVRETEDNVINDIEPYLIQIGFVEIEHRRQLTEEGKKYFDIINS